MWAAVSFGCSARTKTSQVESVSSANQTSSFRRGGGRVTADSHQRFACRHRISTDNGVMQERRRGGLFQEVVDVAPAANVPFGFLGTGESPGARSWCSAATGQARKRASERAPLNVSLATEGPSAGKRRVWRSVSSLASSPMTPEADSTPLHEDGSMPLVTACLLAADERKAEQLTAIRVRHLTYVTSFFVFATGLSRTQISAIARRIEERVEEVLSRKPMSTSFRGVNATPPGRSGWVTIDYGDVIVNIMSPEARSFYNIESLWSQGEAVDVDRILNMHQTRAPAFAAANSLPATAPASEDDAETALASDEWDLEPGAEASFASDFEPYEAHLSSNDRLEKHMPREGGDPTSASAGTEPGHVQDEEL